MVTCMSWWKYIPALCFTLPSVKTVPATYTSKACYGVSGLPCTRHYLSCGATQVIAIADAYYTVNRECSVSGLSSCNVIPEGVKEDGYVRFITAELAPIFSRCSMLTECVYRAQRRDVGHTFSVVKYQCIERNESVRVDGGVANGISRVHVTSDAKWMPSNSSMPGGSKHTCWLQPNETEVDITVYTLDARLRDIQPECLSQPTVKNGNIITVTTCSGLFKPFEKLQISQNLPKSITLLDTPKQKILLWLLINATRPFNIKCEQVTVQTKGVSGVTAIAGYSISSKLTTEEMLHTTSVPNGTKVNVGAVIGGIAVTVLAVSVTTFFMLRFIRKRGRHVQETHSLRDAKTDDTYCLARNSHQSVRHHRGDPKAQDISSDFDYATAEPATYATCEPAASVAESDYNRIDDMPSSLTTDYDTTSSVIQATNPKEQIKEDEYGYNLFQKTITKPLQNDYDTAASATKAVGQLSEIDTNIDEDNYDHFSRATVALETLGSTYDTAGYM